MAKRHLTATALALLAGVVLLSPSALRAEVGEAEAAAKIAEEYGVRVLKVREGEIDGAAVWLVTVMKGGGDKNDAYMVTTLAVDRNSGELLPIFRHRPSGYDLPAGPSRGDKVGIRPDAHHGRAWR